MISGGNWATAWDGWSMAKPSWKDCYGVVNDGGAPGERSGDGAYLPAQE